MRERFEWDQMVGIVKTASRRHRRDTVSFLRILRVSASDDSVVPCAIEGFSSNQSLTLSRILGHLRY